MGGYDQAAAGGGNGGNDAGCDGLACVSCRAAGLGFHCHASPSPGWTGKAGRGSGWQAMAAMPRHAITCGSQRARDGVWQQCLLDLFWRLLFDRATMQPSCDLQSCPVVPLPTVAGYQQGQLQATNSCRLPTNARLCLVRLCPAYKRLAGFRGPLPRSSVRSWPAGRSVARGTSPPFFPPLQFGETA